MKKRITALLLLLTLSVTSLFACTSADKSESASDKTAKTSKSTSTKKQELTPVTLNEVAHSIFYAPMYVAIEKGYFANEGIDLSLVTGFGVSLLVQNLSSELNSLNPKFLAYSSESSYSIGSCPVSPSGTLDMNTIFKVSFEA